VADPAHNERRLDLIAVALCAISAAAGLGSIAAGWAHAPRALGWTGVVWTLTGYWQGRSFGRWRESPTEIYRQARAGRRRPPLTRGILLGAVLFYVAAVVVFFL
jgi:hypothetical protein